MISLTCTVHWSLPHVLVHFPDVLRFDVIHPPSILTIHTHYSAAMARFEDFYNTRHNGRKLEWHAGQVQQSFPHIQGTFYRILQGIW